MDIIDFYRIVAAVLVGNSMTVLVVYVIWRATKLERFGLSSDFLPLPLLLAAIVPFAIVVVAVLSLE